MDEDSFEKHLREINTKRKSLSRPQSLLLHPMVIPPHPLKNMSIMKSPDTTALDHIGSYKNSSGNIKTPASPSLAQIKNAGSSGSFSRESNKTGDSPNPLALLSASSDSHNLKHNNSWSEKTDTADNLPLPRRKTTQHSSNNKSNLDPMIPSTEIRYSLQGFSKKTQSEQGANASDSKFRWQLLKGMIRENSPSSKISKKLIIIRDLEEEKSVALDVSDLMNPELIRARILSQFVQKSGDYQLYVDISKVKSQKYCNLT